VTSGTDSSEQSLPAGLNPVVDPQGPINPVQAVTSTFELPERALDNALTDRQIPRALPFIKKYGLEVLGRPYSNRGEAARMIPAAIEGFYRDNHPDVYWHDRAQITQAARAVLDIYNRNVFPDMRVTWGTYPNNVGHTDFPGCFRCHDGNHSAPDGRVISQDCNACHNLLATQDPNPKILADLGMGDDTK
jgi:hypothetical protein